MRVNLVSVILSTFVANVTVDWSMLGLGAHSAGSDVILQLLKNKTIGAKVTTMLCEHVSYMDGSLFHKINNSIFVFTNPLRNQ